MAKTNVIVGPKMSRRSQKITINNNVKTSRMFTVSDSVSSAICCDQTYSVTQNVFLYKLVFLSRKAVLLSVFLCVCFILQPFEQAAAEEPEVNEIVPAQESTPEVTVEVDSEESEDDSVQENAPVPVSDESTQEPETTDVETPLSSSTGDTSDTTSSTDELEEGIEAAEQFDTQASSTSSNTETSSEETDTPVSSDASDTATTSSSSSQQQLPPAAPSTGGANTDSELDEDEGNDTEDIPTQASSTASSTDQSEDELNENSFVSIVQSDSAFAFTKDECTRIDDGSYYCQEKSTTETLDDSLIAAPDVDGDLEIFLISKGERYQITHNTVDDASPHYDEYSQTIVWHRLVNDRYQIISYDLETGKETQITNTSVNNMEPTRHGEYTVWQRWVDNNWEIILYDGTVEKQITESQRHDIAPHVRGPLVIWNSQSNDGTQELRTYDIQNRTYTTIADGDGVSVSNPRMVVMYEAMYNNGDIVTKGFDLVSGKVVPLASLPRELPEEIPESDSTGETRALIQQKPEAREVEIDDAVDDTATSTDLVSDIQTNTLDLSGDASSESETDENISEPVPEIPDVVVPPLEATSTATSTQ